MPRIIVAGIGQAVLEQAGYPVYEPEIDGWEVLFRPSTTYKSVLDESCWKSVLETADNSPDSGVHIVARHKARYERPGFAAQIHARHRLTWLRSAEVDSYGTETFTALLKDIAAFEEGWRRQIRPADKNHSLILPETFCARSNLKNVWTWAQEIGRQEGNLDKLERQLDWFKQEHRFKEGGWIDTRDLVYTSRRGAKHGGFHDPIGRRWKFTYLVSPGFHFDVRHRRRVDFTIRDRNGVTCEREKYINVSCHGSVWGGE